MEAVVNVVRDGGVIGGHDGIGGTSYGGHAKMLTVSVMAACELVKVVVAMVAKVMMIEDMVVAMMVVEGGGDNNDINDGSSGIPNFILFIKPLTFFIMSFL